MKRLSHRHNIARGLLAALLVVLLAGMAGGLPLASADPLPDSSEDVQQDDMSEAAEKEPDPTETEDKTEDDDLVEDKTEEGDEEEGPDSSDDPEPKEDAKDVRPQGVSVLADDTVNTGDNYLVWSGHTETTFSKSTAIASFSSLDKAFEYAGNHSGDFTIRLMTSNVATPVADSTKATSAVLKKTSGTVRLTTKADRVLQRTSNTTQQNAPSLIKVTGGCTLEIIDSQFSGRSNNSFNITSSGGLFWIGSGCTLSILGNVTMKDANVGSNYGGAIYIDAGGKLETSGTLTIENCKAHDGGAIYAANKGTTKATIELGGGVTISACEATNGYGGGIYAGKESSLTVGAATITNCKAATGGGVALGQFENEDLDSTEEWSVNASFAGTTISGCEANRGGGISAGRKSTVTLSGGTNITGCTALTGEARGGGIDVGRDSKVTVTSGTISNCWANIGGGLFGRARATIELGSSTTSGTVLIDSCSATAGEARGGGIDVRVGSTVTLDGSAEIKNCKASRGGGIFASTEGDVSGTETKKTVITLKGNSSVHDCTTINETTDDSGVTTYSIISGASGTGARGGGINAMGAADKPAEVNISESAEVYNNTSTEGGGIFTQENSTVTISDSAKVHDNTARYIDRDEHKGIGGGICIRASSTLNVSDSAELTGNRAIGSYDDRQSQNTDNQTNTDTGNGGAINAYGTSCTINLSGSTKILNNEAGRKGGAIAMNSTVGESAGLVVEGDVLFQGNKAHGEGGGVLYTNEGAKVEIKNTGTTGVRFLSNEATDYTETVEDGGTNHLNGSGGALYLSKRGSLNITGKATFDGNKSRNRGGAISASQAATIVIGGGSAFANNECTDGPGGAITVLSNSGSDKSTITIHEATIGPNNVAKSNGGGIQIGAYAELTMDSLDSIVRGNTARDSNGGGVCTGANCKVTMERGSVLGNKALSGKGGGLYIASSSTLTTQHSSQIGDKDAGNQAKNGGGVYLDENATGTFTQETSIAHNSATGDGGGVYRAKGTSPFIGPDSAGHYLTIHDNKAQNGAGIYLEAEGITQLSKRVKIYDNAASKFGGGIYAGGTERNVHITGDITVKGNTGAQDSKVDGVSALDATPVRDNIYLPKDNYLWVYDAITSESNDGWTIGVRHADREETGELFGYAYNALGSGSPTTASADNHYNRIANDRDAYLFGTIKDNVRAQGATDDKGIYWPSGTLVVSKKVEGAFANKNKEFEFMLSLAKCEDDESAAEKAREYRIYTFTDNGTATDVPVDLPSATPVATITRGGSSVKVKLKHGQGLFVVGVAMSGETTTSTGAHPNAALTITETDADVTTSSTDKNKYKGLRVW